MRFPVPSRRSFSWVAALTFCALLWFGAAQAHAQGQGASGYRITFVARECTSYTDIFANRARNNIVESLKDLGPDTQYPVAGGVLIDPVHEDIPPQTNCRPLVGWHFTMGTGIATNRVTGDWGSLSVVSAPFATSIVTRTSTNLLTTTGANVPGRSIAGAETINLTNAQRDQASRSALWVQGGTPTDPVLAGPGLFPGPQYGFGTLRCATDNLNGDNVEYVFFPTGVTHVFCYAYYVKPPPTTGVITIRKRVVGAPANTNPSFLFNGTNPGNLSFDPNGFTLVDGQQMEFFRAGGVAWNVTEAPVANFGVPSISCVNGDGSPAANAAVNGRTVTISLVALQHVTCTFTNTYIPPPGGLTITKITHGGVGTFSYDVTPVSGGTPNHVTATTTVEGVPVDATPSLTSLPPGSYRIVEHRPVDPEGNWRLAAVSCNGTAQSTTAPVQVTIASGQQVSCQFTNGFTPKGAISLAKITQGATGRVVFQIDRASRRMPGVFLQTATTTHQGVAAHAVPNTPADATDRLRLGTYRITEQAPPSVPADGWTLESVTCNGVLMPFEQGSTLVTLTRAEPRVHCVFTDTFSRHPEPEPAPEPPAEPPPSPGIPPQVTPDQPASPWSDLAVSKTASPRTVAVGSVVIYRITVRNHGPDSAARVVLSDALPAGATLLSFSTTVGSCQSGAPLICRLGTLKPGAKVTVTLRVRMDRESARVRNRAVVGTATYDPRLANNVSHAVVRVTPPAAPPPFTG